MVQSNFLLELGLILSVWKDCMTHGWLLLPGLA